MEFSKVLNEDKLTKHVSGKIHDSLGNCRVEANIIDSRLVVTVVPTDSFYTYSVVLPINIYSVNVNCAEQEQNNNK